MQVHLLKVYILIWQPLDESEYRQVDWRSASVPYAVQRKYSRKR